jgi:hypothetical protein
LFWTYVLGGSALIMLLASLENPQSVVGRLVGLMLFGAASFGLGVYLWITYDAIRHPNAFINYLHDRFSPSANTSSAGARQSDADESPVQQSLPGESHDVTRSNSRRRR